MSIQRRNSISALDALFALDTQHCAGSSPKGDGAYGERPSGGRSLAKQGQNLEEDLFRANYVVPEPRYLVVLKAVVQVCIIANFFSLGFESDYPQETTLWIVCDHFFTFIFTLEMVVKAYVLRTNYLYDRWNNFDCVLAWMNILDVWIFGMMYGMDSSLRSLSAVRTLRMFRIMRLVRVVEIKKELVVLVEGLYASIKSLCWLVILMTVVIYTSALFVRSMVLDHNYDVLELDTKTRFGTVCQAMFTLFNMCIIAEWGEIMWPIYYNQPVLFIYLMIFLWVVTFGILNLVIGVIAERTMAATQAVLAETQECEKSERMHNIVMMAEKIFSTDEDGKLTRHEMEDLVSDKNPELLELLMSCDLPRGFDIGDLHLIFDEQMEGTVSKEEFVTGMFRLIFNSEFQTSCCLLMTIAQVKASVHEEMENLKRKLDKEAKDLRENSTLSNKELIPQTDVMTAPMAMGASKQLLPSPVETKGGEDGMAAPMAMEASKQLLQIPVEKKAGAATESEFQEAWTALAEVQELVKKALSTAPDFDEKLRHSSSACGSWEPIKELKANPRLQRPGAVTDVQHVADPASSNCLCSGPWSSPRTAPKSNSCLVESNQYDVDTSMPA